MQEGLELHLREIRQAQHVDLDNIATALGWSRSYISRLERGERQLTLASLLRWAAVLQRHPQDLMTFVGFPPPTRCGCQVHTTQGDAL